MKILLNFINKWLIAVPILIMLALIGSCSDLTEPTYGSLTPDNFFQNEAEATSALAGIYERMSGIMNYGDPWRIQVMGTDEFIIAPLATGGWFDGGKFIQIARHEVPATNTAIAGGWSTAFGVIGAANAIIPAIQESPAADQLVAEVAEAKLLRAYAYFYLMDWFGNVPIFTDARIDQTDLPSTNTRQEVFTFVVDEMLAAADVLPSINDVNRSDYYPRFTKETAYAALALIHLNAEVYTGTPEWGLAEQYANEVINSQGYILEDDIVSAFNSTNGTSQELIASFSQDPFANAGGNQYVRGTMHPAFGDAWDLPFTPANGYKAISTAVERYEPQDRRYQAFVFEGPQFDRDGNPIMDPTTGNQLELIDLVEPNRVSGAEEPRRGVEDNEGYRILKYTADGSFLGRYTTNDIVMMRYANVLMIKAEALFRQDETSIEALNLVNEIRERSDLLPWGSLTLERIEEERAREFALEGERRRDMIRFGSYFNETWPTKPTTTEEFRGLYPIPQEQLNSNPNLDQNPGYN